MNLTSRFDVKWDGYSWQLDYYKSGKKKSEQTWHGDFRQLATRIANYRIGEGMKDNAILEDAIETFTSGISEIEAMIKIKEKGDKLG